jgi:hypothetical protein
LFWLLKINFIYLLTHLLNFKIFIIINFSLIVKIET